MKDYTVKFERENGTIGEAKFTEPTEGAARHAFSECYRHGTGKIISIEESESKVSKRLFAKIVAEHMALYIEPLREHARQNFEAWYENDAIYAMFTGWSDNKERALYDDAARMADPESLADSSFHHGRVDAYREVIYGVLLSGVNTSKEETAE